MEFPVSQQILTMFMVVAQGSAPLLIVSSAVGLVLAILQGLLQINDQTLPQVVKLLVAAVLLIAFGSYFFAPVLGLAQHNFNLIAELGR